jgi:hypothetical protein
MSIKLTIDGNVIKQAMYKDVQTRDYHKSRISSTII